MTPTLTVRPFEHEGEYAAMVDYFVGGSDAFLHGMGIDVAKVPTRAAWLASVLADHGRPDREKERLFVAWLAEGELVGHSSLSHIRFGDTAHCHLHLWRPELRGAGRGREFLALSIDLYFERFDLRTLACEPYAENAGPNAVLPKLGFRRVRRYRTVPTAICFEQDVERYEVDREDWFASRRGCGA